MNNPTDAELSRAVAEKLPGWEYVSFRSGGMSPGRTPYWKSPEGRKHHGFPRFATDWQLIGPEIEKRWIDPNFLKDVSYFVRVEKETLPRAACLAILEE